MLTRFLLFILFAKLLMPVAQVVAGPPQTPSFNQASGDTTEGSRAISADLRLNLPSYERLKHTLSHVEQQFDLKPGTLSQGRYYRPDQLEAVDSYLHREDSFLWYLPFTSPDWTLFVSPSHIPAEEARGPVGALMPPGTLMFLRVYDDGRIVPMGFSKVKPGHNFFHLVSRKAWYNLKSLRDLYANVRVVNP